MLIAMAVYDTVENKRTKMTQATCQSLVNTVDWDRHRLIMVDNGSCDETQDLYSILKYEIPDLKVIWNGTNLGTAMAINKAWKHRRSRRARRKDGQRRSHPSAQLGRLHRRSV